MATPAGAAGAGIVYLVGAGPGDPGLQTVRARALLATSDALVYDALVHPDIIAMAARDRVVPLDMHFVGKRGGQASTPQEEINALLIRLAREGKRVVRLKGGDPFVFGRGSEEAQVLAGAGVAFEVVPGVTAGVAAPAYAGIPVTHRGVATSVTFVTGHEDPARERSGTDWSALARAGGTIVLYMGVKRLSDIVTALVEQGGMTPETPVAVIEWGTCASQRTVTATLSTIVEQARAEGIGAPAITVIGDVVRFREQIAWFDRRPLHGRRIVVTRARAQASALSELLRARGAEVVEVPAIRIEPVDGAALQAALDTVQSYDWLILTSRNAVTIMWEALRRRGLDARALAGVKLCAVGPGTAEALLEHGLAVDLVPERAVAEGVMEALAARPDVRGSRVFFPRAEGARDLIPTALGEMGATVDAVTIYRSVPDGAGAEPLRGAIDRGEVDCVTFTSSSTVRFFVDAVGAERARALRAASIGPVTSATARELGLTVAAEARTATIAGLVDAVTELLAGEPV
ncbi:MAG TPA: uroporphyrinogen-III C-methyltransferase [Gemmatimonadaceae bacterium]|nr:uroporphyrinogen-III C-methyltransferase [Gemmatimonadaceae bacterium]